MTKQQRLIAVVLVAAAALAAILLAAKKRAEGPADAGPLVKGDLSLTRVLQRDVEQDFGFLYVPYARAASGSLRLNVAVDLNGDGAFAAYDVDGGKQEEWLVRNVAVFAAAGATVGSRVSLPDRTIGAKLPAAAEVVFTDAAIEGDAWPTALPEGATVEKVRVSDLRIADRDALNVPEPGSKRDQGRGAPGAAPARQEGDTGPASQVEGEPYQYAVKNHDMPDQDQRSSECSPTGISNAFRWLAKQHHLEDRMPSTTESVINELKGDLQWDNGVEAGQNTIDGKRAFIARHQLPFEAHLIAEEWDHNIQYKIYQEMQKGQAVEVGIAFIKPDGGWDGAHLVGVAGVANFGGGERWIDLVDPSEPARTDGGNSEMYKMNGNEIIDYQTGAKARIRYAYAQSPILDDKGNLVDPWGGDDFVLDPGEQLTEPGSDVTHSRGDFGFFQVAIDHPGDHMVGESFDAVASVIFTGREKRLYYYVNGEDRRYAFKAGKPWSLRGHFLGGGNVTPDNVLLRPDRGDQRGERVRLEARFTCEKPGPARIKYVADLGWPIDGPAIPADLPEKYRRQIRREQTMVVDSPMFRCLARPTASTNTNTGVAPTPFCPGLEEDPNGTEVAVLKFRNKCYPTAQFHVAEPDRCTANHWHPNAAMVIALDGTKTAEPDPACGFGKVSEVPAGTVKLSPDQAAPFIGGALGR